MNHHDLHVCIIPRHTTESLLTAYVSRCSGSAAGILAPPVVPVHGHEQRAENLDPEQDSDEEIDEFHIEVDAAAYDEDWLKDLNGADRECYDLLKSLQAREQADSIPWEKIGEEADGPTDALDAYHLDEHGTQRLGCRTVPPAPLDKETWKDACPAEDPVDGDDVEAVAPRMTCNKDVSKRLVTLTHVFQHARLGDGDLSQVDVLTPTLLRCLRNLRSAADSHVLPHPENFRGRSKRKLNWHQQCEREAAVIRLLTGVSSKRTSRANAWRALSASLRKAVGVEETCDLASGQAVLFAPMDKQKQWQLGVVLTVWRKAAKGCRPTALPIPQETAKYFRVVQLEPVANAVEGTYSAHADSLTSVCPIYRLGLTLHIQTTKAGVDGLQVILGQKELDAIKVAREWTQWDSKTNLRMGRKRRAQDAPASAPQIVLLDDDKDDEEVGGAQPVQPDQPASSAKNPTTRKSKPCGTEGINASGSAGVKPTIKNLGIKE